MHDPSFKAVVNQHMQSSMEFNPSHQWRVGDERSDQHGCEQIHSRLVLVAVEFKQGRHLSARGRCRPAFPGLAHPVGHHT